MTKINLGDFKVDALNQDEVISEIKKNLLKSVAPHILVTPNAGHLKNINTPLKICMQRDSKNLYKKEKSIKNFSKIGLTGDYEAPINPDIKIDTSKESISNSVSKIIYKIF